MLELVVVGESMKLGVVLAIFRAEVAEKVVWVLHGIGNRVGAENFKRHMAAPLQRLLCTYDALFCLQGSPPTLAFKEDDALAASQLRAIFTPIFAAKISRLFSDLCGKRYFELSLPNSQLLLKLVEMGASASAVDALILPSKGAPAPASLPSSFLLPPISPASAPVLHDLVDRLPKSERALRGNWLRYWEKELARGEREELKEMAQLKLLTFAGHSGPIRQIEVMENENSFLSTSSDKTIRLWSLRNAGEGDARVECQWAYRGHKKAVVEVGLCPSVRLWASTDGGSVDVWDPFLGARVREVEVGGAAEAVGLKCEGAPRQTALVAASDGTLRVLDMRCASWAAELKLSGAALRGGLALDGEWLVVATQTGGCLSLLDLRTGRCPATRKVADSEISHLRGLSDQSFCLSIPDSPVSVWNFADLGSRCKLQGTLDGLSCVEGFPGTAARPRVGRQPHPSLLRHRERRHLLGCQTPQRSLSWRQSQRSPFLTFQPDLPPWSLQRCHPSYCMILYVLIRICILIRITSILMI